MSLRPATGHLCLTLHAHLPFVRHPEHELFLEELWFYEAMIETYIPLLRVMEGWERDEIYWRLTMSVTPPLHSMMRDELLKLRFEDHLAKLEDLLDDEMERTRDRPEFHRTALHYRQELVECRRVWEEWDRDLVAAFRRHLESGKLEIITCGATHGFLPYLAEVPEAVRAQVEVACRSHEEAFGRRPKGIWLPECAYIPENDRFLKDSGLTYCFNDAHGLLSAHPPPSRGVFAPLASKDGIHCFGRDLESSRQVWSREVGYPGDSCYREFYRDVGYDLDWDYISPYVHEDLGIRINTGIKYHAVTGEVDLADKDLYDPEKARERAAQHAWNFVFNRQNQVRWLAERMDRAPLVVSPYDAELYGHWWYEGPWFVDHVMRAMDQHPDQVSPSHPREYLEEYPESEVAELHFSTWGAEGYGEVWLNSTNEWIYRHLHAAGRLLARLARQYRDADDWRERVLDQMGRELLLAQASDWAFIMNAQTAVEYAEKRTRVHLHRFHVMAGWIEKGAPDEALLEEYEAKDNIFPRTMDFRLYA